MKLTPWYPPHIKPVRPGVYRTADGDGDEFFQHWNGNFWAAINLTIQQAKAEASVKSQFLSSPQWRGLAKEPK